MKEPARGTPKAKVSSSSWLMAQLNHQVQTKGPYRIRVEPSCMSSYVDRVQQMAKQLTTAPLRPQQQLASPRRRGTVISHL